MQGVLGIHSTIDVIWFPQTLQVILAAFLCCQGKVSGNIES
jgi:hypothetical protein